MGRDLCVEVKARADVFRELYCGLNERDTLIVKADRQEPLVFLRMSLAAEIAKSGGMSIRPARISQAEIERALSALRRKQAPSEVEVKMGDRLSLGSSIHSLCPIGRLQHDEEIVL